MRIHSNTTSCILVVLLMVSGQVHANASASNIVVHIDRHDDAAPTPIHQEYLALINSADNGDQIILLQKYFRNRDINQAIVDAAGRGVKVTGIYRDVVSPPCEDLLPLRSSVDCSQLFIQHRHVHHKSMVLHRTNGNTSAIIGSFNLRERHSTSARTHTALSFDVAADSVLFPFYKAHSDGIRGLRSDASSLLSLTTAGGGKMLLTFHPSDENPVIDLLGHVSQCEGPLWLSYYGAMPDKIGEPVFRRLGELVERGCDVRFLLDRHRDNHVAEQRLRSLGVTVHYPNNGDENVTLGHKLVVARSGGRLHLIQSSANLDYSHHRCQHNLTLYLTGDFPAVARSLNLELSRYW